MAGETGRRERKSGLILPRIGDANGNRQVAYFMQTSEKGLAGNLIKENDLEKLLTNYFKSIEVALAREAAKLTINQLLYRANNDPCTIQKYWLNPRYAALCAVLEDYPNHPQTLPLLHNRAENDPDEKLWEFATKKLKEIIS